ncbi:MAG: TlpA family protein disulfide reductase [Bacteroidales bacterium]|nr:TlpA family protein disulfide reductase [Bacteroidales bacterium]
MPVSFYRRIIISGNEKVAKVLWFDYSPPGRGSGGSNQRINKSENIPMMRLCNIALFLSLSAILLKAQPVVITGNAPSYVGDELVFYTIADFISQTEKEIGRSKITVSGDFRIEIPADETLKVFAHLGVFKLGLWIEPGQKYKVILPEKVEKTPQDILNPYFEHVEAHLAIENFREDELNTLIMMFKDAYNPYYDKHVNDIYTHYNYYQHLKDDNNKTQPARIEEDIEQIEKSFREYENDYFKAYRLYSYGQLNLFANRQKVKSISREYFTDKPILYTHPAYMDLFGQVYDKYLTFLSRSDDGKKIYDDINQLKSYSSLFQTLSVVDNMDNDTLRELVILKSIHDEYYGMEFSRNGLLCILDSLILSSRIHKHQEIGKHIKHKITRLQPGYDPPCFKLLDADSNLVSLTDFKGKYVYLNFCTSYSYTCLNEFKLLNDIHQRHHQRLTIITISTDPYEITFDQFKNRNNYNWIFLYYGHQPDIIKEYDIRAFPTYFLIGPDGKLIYSPAPAPSENFEIKLFEAMRAKGDL